MANPEHVRAVKQGAEAIADRRKRYPWIRLELRGANLIDANLNRADLNRANLNHVDLSRADLSFANLINAKLIDANLDRADLSRADLSRADLSFAHFTGADLTGADLTGARVGFTTFARCDLSEAKGLEDVEHQGPSSIGVDTIILSQGKIPRIFLEGAGIPDTWIEYIPFLTLTPLEFYSAFLSHSHSNKEFTDKLYADLKEKRVRVWYFPADARGGRRVEREIYQAIRYYDKVMVVCSKEALASEAVRDEIDQAIQKQKERRDWVLFPIAIDDTVYQEDSEFARRLRRHVIEDFRRWREPAEYQKALNKLIKDLATQEPPQNSPSTSLQ